ncbi:hypothetical protein K505DRAFT_324018 [Melanomma pulvis-pyrius CBS 109.77]|uniref:Uncharacterized protein n=1 Tax=Melanomma pulvis-pyrius CBS 109.77 TaxID=1314802 RepID=A0A6A6XHY3_9PLEO|nr:hypothetical protein K505DRAFT_324018 [Melanomma pulvis-pyrius CBS 109.77]
MRTTGTRRTRQRAITCRTIHAWRSEPNSPLQLPLPSSSHSTAASTITAPIPHAASPLHLNIAINQPKPTQKCHTRFLPVPHAVTTSIQKHATTPRVPSPETPRAQPHKQTTRRTHRPAPPSLPLQQRAPPQSHA